MTSYHRIVRLGMVLITVLFVSDAPAEHQLGDITMNLKSNAHGIPAVIFPHWKHRSQFRCYASNGADFPR